MSPTLQWKPGSQAGANSISLVPTLDTSTRTHGGFPLLCPTPNPAPDPEAWLPHPIQHLLPRQGHTAPAPQKRWRRWRRLEASSRISPGARSPTRGRQSREAPLQGWRNAAQGKKEPQGTTLSLLCNWALNCLEKRQLPLHQNIHLSPARRWREDRDAQLRDAHRCSGTLSCCRRGACTKQSTGGATVCPQNAPRDAPGAGSWDQAGPGESGVI